MKVVKNYNEATYSTDDKITIYKNEHENYYFFINKKPLDSLLHNKIVNLLPTGNSVWIDSFGYAMCMKRVISFEHRHNKEVFDGLSKEYKIHLAGDFLAKSTIKTIEKIYKPSSIVFYFSPFLKYKTLEEFNTFLTVYFNFFLKRKLILLIDLTFIKFNRIRLTNTEAIKIICNHIPHLQIKTQKLDTFRYMLEIN